MLGDEQGREKARKRNRRWRARHPDKVRAGNLKNGVHRSTIWRRELKAAQDADKDTRKRERKRLMARLRKRRWRAKKNQLRA
jgi:hypothetical protein